MGPRRLRLQFVTISLLLAFPFITGADGGCTQQSAPTGRGMASDSGTAGDSGAGCAAADCSGLAAPALAKLCPGGTSVGATLCASGPTGACEWTFPPCPAVAEGGCPGLGCDPACPNGVLVDSNGCPTCQCAPAADGGDASAADAASDVAACSWPAEADTFSDAGGTGCQPQPAFNDCTVPNGGSVEADGAIVAADGAPVRGACRDLCSASEYSLTCSGPVPSPGTSGGIPSPAASLGCTIIPIPTPSNALFYCCPCTP
jgi:hypothetical protein